MALILADRVRETTSTNGTGSVTLNGAVRGYQSFAAVGNGNTTYYTITNGTQWEVGIGTYSTSGPTLSRDTVLSSSTGSKVSFSAGFKDVFITYPAEQAITSTALSATTGAALIGLAQGGTVQNLASIYANAVFSASYGSVELAHAAAVSAGKAYVVVNSAWALTGNFTATLKIIFAPGFTVSCGSYTLNLSNGFQADDTQQVFFAVDASNITLPQWQRLTPFHFGAEGNYVSSGSPGADDTAAINAWANFLCWRIMPPAKYGISGTIYWNGTTTNSYADGIKAEPGAELWQRTDNTPIMTFYGSRGEWRFPKLCCENVQATTNYSAIALLNETVPGLGNGFYMSNVGRLHTLNAATGAFFSRAISTTLSATTSAGGNTFTVTNAPTDLNGQYPWVKGMIAQVQLDNNTFLVSRVTNVSGSVITLADAAPAGRSAPSGNGIYRSTSVMTAGATPVAPTRFSNTWDFIMVENPTRWGWVDTGYGTQDFIANRYIDCTQSTNDVTNQPQTLVSAIHEPFRNGDQFGITNIEHFNFTGDACYFGSEPFDLGKFHFESCVLKTDLTGLISGTARSLSVRQVQAQYCTFLSSNLATAGGIFCPRTTGSTAIGSTFGIWTCDVLQTTKNIVTYGTAFPLITPTGRFQELRIGTWEYSRDSGFMPRGLLSYPSTTSGTVLVGNLHPADCVAYGFDLDINDGTTYQPIQSSNKGQYMIREVLLAAPSVSMTTGTAGIYQDNTGASLVSSANNIALSPLSNTTTGSGNAMLMTLQAGETGKVRVGGQSLYWKTNAAQAKPSGFSSGSTTSSLSGRNGGNNNTNLGTINFGTSHAFVNGQTIDITGSAKTALNGRFKIVDTPDSNTIVIYVDSATAVASSADAALTATLVPTLSAYLRGADIGAYNAH